MDAMAKPLVITIISALIHGLAGALILAGDGATRTKSVGGLDEFYDAQFKSYPAGTAFVATKKPEIQWRANKKALRYKTKIREAWSQAREPNFAGHFLAIDDIGCGTGCRVVFVIDWETGAVINGPEDHSFQTRRDSRLLILKPYPNCTVYGKPILYEFVENRFREIQHDRCS